MLNRRQFLSRTAITGGGLALSGGLIASASQAADGPVPRREVSVNGKRALVVDIHAHCVFPEVAPMLEGSGIEGNFAKSQVLTDRRIQQMNQRGIDYQALSVNTYWWYAANQDLAAKVVRAHDEGLAAWCKAHPDRFVPLSSPALQFPELAAEQLEYAVKNLGSRGGSVGGHVNGEVPVSEKYDPFWKKAEELGVTVFMHPGGAENVLQENALEGSGDLGNIIGNPLETTVFLSHVIFSGLLDRFPKLNISAAHGGGYVPSYLGRTEAACEYRGNAKCVNKKKPSEYFKSQLVIDSMVFSEEGIRHLVAEVGASQVVYGSDLPFNWPDTIDIIVNSPNLTDQQKIDILGGNLVKLLKIKA